MPIQDSTHDSVFAKGEIGEGWAARQKIHCRKVAVATVACTMEETGENKDVGEETGLVRTMGTRPASTKRAARLSLSLL